MRQALHAEWTKLRTVAGPSWLLLATIVATVAPSVFVLAAERYANAGAGVDLTKLSLTGIYLGQAIVAILGVLVTGGEYSCGLMRTTFTALPRRTTVLGAKAAIVGVMVLVAGAVAVLGCLLAGRLVLPGHGFTAAHGYELLSFAHGSTLRAAAGSVLYLALIALLSLGVLAAWAAAALLIGGLALEMRDA